MRWTPSLKEKIFDRIESGVFIGDDGAPNGRVTIEADWSLSTTSPVYGNSLRAPYRAYTTGNQIEHEVPSIQSIRISRSLNQDIATCTITIYNAWHEANEAQPELNGQLGQPGYFWPKRGDGDSGPTWNQNVSMGAYKKDGTWDNTFSWRNALVEDALIRTYQGYGGRPTDGNYISIDDNLASDNIVQTGVWLVDTVVGNHSGMMILTCRDVGRLLLDQIVFPPTVPSSLYPVEYVPAGKSRFDSLWGPRARAVPSSAYGSRGPVKIAPIWASSFNLPVNDDVVNDHPLAAAVDGDVQDFCLTEAFDKRIAGPDRTDTAWMEFAIENSDTLSSVALTPWAGGYKIFVSAMVDGDWIDGEHKEGEPTVVPAFEGDGKDIPYVTQIYIPEQNPGASGVGEAEVYAELRRKIPDAERFNAGLITERERQHWYGKETQPEEDELVQLHNVQKIRLSIQRFYYSGMPDSNGNQFRAGFKTIKAFCMGQNKTPYETTIADIPWTWNIASHPTRGYWVLENTGTVHGFGDAADYDSDSLGDSVAGVDDERRWVRWSAYPGEAPPYGSNYNHWFDPYEAGTLSQPSGTLMPSGQVIGGGQVYHRQQNRAHGIAATPSGQGYWIVDWMGNVKTYGDATYYGEFPVYPPGRYADWRVDWLRLYREGFTEIRDGKGVVRLIDPNWSYTVYLAPNTNPAEASGFLSSTWGSRNKVFCTGIASTPSGEGYWVLYSHGVIGAFGDAATGTGLSASMNVRDKLSNSQKATTDAFRNIQSKYLHYGRVSYGYTKDYYISGMGTSIEAHPKKKGFWVVDECGQVTAFGEAVNWGGLENRTYNSTAQDSFTLQLFDYAVDITSTDTGDGYWILFNSGKVAAFGDALKKGPVSLFDINKQYDNVAVGASKFDASYYQKLFYSMSRDPDGRGFWILRADGQVYFYEAEDWGSPGWNGLTGFRWHEGNFDGDYADIVREMVMWAGFTYYEPIKDKISIQTTVPEGFTVNGYGVYDPDSVTEGTLAQYEQINALGGIESTAIKQDIEIKGDKWDKKLIIDVIRELAEVVGYVVYIDQEGGFRFRSPNWWRSGNIDYKGQRIWSWTDLESGEWFRIPEEFAADAGAEPYIPIIHETTDMMAYSATLNNTDKKWQIIIGTETPDPRDITRTAHVQHFPPSSLEEIRPGVPSSRNIPRTAIWTSQIFENAEERALMAEVVGIRSNFASRTGTTTAVANPCLDVDDQIRLVERTTSETYIHRIQGLETDMNLDDGTYVMNLQTHWLGSADNWVLVTTADGDPWAAPTETGYKLGNRVSYEGVTYISAIADNYSVPGTNTDWVEQTSVDNPYVVISERLDSWQRETGRGLELAGYAAQNDYMMQLTGAFNKATTLSTDGDPSWGIWYTGTGDLASNNSSTFKFVNYKSMDRGLLWPFNSNPMEAYEDDGASMNSAKLRAASQGFIYTLGSTPEHLQGTTVPIDNVPAGDAVDIGTLASGDVLTASDLTAAGGYSGTFANPVVNGFGGLAFSYDRLMTSGGRDYEISGAIFKGVSVTVGGYDGGGSLSVNWPDGVSAGRAGSASVSGAGASDWGVEPNIAAVQLQTFATGVTNPVDITLTLDMLEAPIDSWPEVVTVLTDQSSGDVPPESVSIDSVEFIYTEVATTTETRAGEDYGVLIDSVGSPGLALGGGSDVTPPIDISFEAFDQLTDYALGGVYWTYPTTAPLNGMVLRGARVSDLVIDIGSGSEAAVIVGSPNLSGAHVAGSASANGTGSADWDTLAGQASIVTTNDNASMNEDPVDITLYIDDPTPALGPGGTWTPSYPLDTPTGKVRFGATLTSGSVATKYETPTGKSLAMHRQFRTWNQRLDLDNYLNTANAAGRASWLSLKTPENVRWADFVNNYDTQVDEVLDSLKDTGKNVWFSPFHEPEDNTDAEAGSGFHYGTPADWISMLDYWEQRRQMMGANNILIVPILMASTFNHLTRDPADWVSLSPNYPVYGIDPYTNDYSTSPASLNASASFSAAVSYLVGAGKDIGIAEFGGQIGTSGVRPVALWEGLVAECLDPANRIKAACWFDDGNNQLNASPGDPSGDLYDAVLATFSSSDNYREGLTGSSVGSLDQDPFIAIGAGAMAQTGVEIAGISAAAIEWLWYRP